MALGDVFDVVITSVPNGGFLDVRPSPSQEAVIHNIYVGGAWELYKSDGTNSIKVDDGVANVGPVSAALHVTNTRYLRIKNVSGASAFFSADGIQTK